MITVCIIYYYCDYNDYFNEVYDDNETNIAFAVVICSKNIMSINDRDPFTEGVG